MRKLALLLSLAAGLTVFAPATPDALANHPGEDLHVVRPDVGPALLTHGQDPMPAAEELAAYRGGQSGGVGFEPGDPERAPICTAADHQHVLYARVAGAANRANEVRASLRAAVRRTNAVLNSESLASGGSTADYKVRCDGTGDIAVDSFTTTGSTFAQVVSDARAAGFNSNAADYLIFFDAERAGSCGVGSYTEDERLTASNESNFGGGFAVVYRDCWFTEIPMHEVGHTMGAVQYGAPHSTGTGGHCWQENDVLCYSPDGGDLHQGGTVQNCAGTPRFDCGFDDYFDSAPEPGEYLASHWNLGSGLNRFVAFGQGAQDPGTDLIGSLIQDLLGAGRTKADADALAGQPGDWSMFELEITRPARKLVVRVRDADGMSLYVRRLKEPTDSSYACKATPRDGTAVCNITKPRRGRWIAGVRNDSAAAGDGYRIDAKIKKRR
jgi:hypothetical protein